MSLASSAKRQNRSLVQEVRDRVRLVAAGAQRDREARELTRPRPR